jgi:hypothetical protein
MESSYGSPGRQLPVRGSEMVVDGACPGFLPKGDENTPEPVRVPGLGSLGTLSPRTNPDSRPWLAGGNHLHGSYQNRLPLSKTRSLCKQSG